MASLFTHTPQSFMLDGIDATAYFTKVAQSLLLSAFDATVFSSFTHTPQVVVLSAYALQDNMPRVSQSLLLSAFGEGNREFNKVRAWAFTLDGHWFYVLTLGTLGSYLYDFVSKQWCKWETTGYDGIWNAEYGIMWNNRIVVGDNQNGLLWEVDPKATLDGGYAPIAHKVTAIIPARGRSFIEHDAVYITASVGQPTGISPSINLSFSDDDGATWTDMDPILLTNDRSQEIAWTSLGSFTSPGRIITISDTGGPIRIDGAETFQDGDQNDDGT